MQGGGGASSYLKMFEALGGGTADAAVRVVGSQQFANRKSRQKLKEDEKRREQGKLGLSDMEKGRRLAQVQDAVSARSKAAEADLARQGGQLGQGGAIANQQAAIIQGEQATAAGGAMGIQEQSDIVAASENKAIDRSMENQRQINLAQTDKIAAVAKETTEDAIGAWSPGSSGDISEAGVDDANATLDAQAAAKKAAGAVGA
tara:strand:- start:3019 stop:3627 length:609 start_codon:yes stop_codon:yes gene_type:complete